MSPPPPIDLKRADGSVACRLTAEKIVSAGGGRLMCRGRVKVSAGNALAECASLLVDPERGVAQVTCESREEDNSKNELNSLITYHLSLAD